MLRSGLCLLTASIFLLPIPAQADDAKDLKIIATAKEVTVHITIGPFELKRRDLVVIRSAEELVAASTKAASAKDPAVQKELTGALAKLLKVDAIDWNKQMVVFGIADGMDSLKSDGKTLAVTYLRHPEQLARRIQPYPKILVLTERFEGDVKFTPKEVKKDPKN